jgi:hypothetical protein
VPASASRQADIEARLRWAPRGPTAGPARTWVGPLGSAQLDRIFFEFIFNVKTIPEKSRNCLKAQKYSENHKIFRKILRARLEHEQSK